MAKDAKGHGSDARGAAAAAPDAIGATDRARYGSMTDSDLGDFARSTQSASEQMRGQYSDAAAGSYAKQASDARSVLAARHPVDRAAASALTSDHPKQRLVGVHPASAISRAVRAVKGAFRNSDG